MFNKLKNLIFEEEDIIEEDEDNFEESFDSEPVAKPVKQKASKKVEKPVIEDNYFEEEKPVSRVSKVEQVVEPKDTYVPSSKPKVQQFDNVKLNNLKTTNTVVEQPKPVSQPKSSLGIEVDDIKTYEPVKKPTMSSTRTTRNSSSVNTKKVAKVETNSTYERRPVISPIFGLSEKDVKSSMNSTLVPKTNKDEEKDDVISPIYGNAIRKTIIQEAEQNKYTETKQEENYSQLAENKQSIKEDNNDDVPVFSLDDILASRDEQDKKIAKSDVKETPTRVVNSRNYSLFDDED